MPNSKDDVLNCYPVNPSRAPSINLNLSSCLHYTPTASLPVCSASYLVITTGDILNSFSSLISYTLLIIRHVDFILSFPQSHLLLAYPNSPNLRTNHYSQLANAINSLPPSISALYPASRVTFIKHKPS